MNVGRGRLSSRISRRIKTGECELEREVSAENGTSGEGKQWEGW
jgi:hypothetical protein